MLGLLTSEPGVFRKDVFRGLAIADVLATAKTLAAELRADDGVAAARGERADGVAQRRRAARAEHAVVRRRDPAGAVRAAVPPAVPARDAEPRLADRGDRAGGPSPIANQNFQGGREKAGTRGKRPKIALEELGGPHYIFGSPHGPLFPYPGFSPGLPRTPPN